MAPKPKDNALSPSEFLDKLQGWIIEIGDSAQDGKEKLLAIKEGINLAKVRGAMDDESDDEGMGFPQR